VIEYIHDLSAYANLFEYYEKNENERWTITLMHELGPKWSAFLGEPHWRGLRSGRGPAEDQDFRSSRDIQPLGEVVCGRMGRTMD
jgi:hypothetical protein